MSEQAKTIEAQQADLLYEVSRDHSPNRQDSTPQQAAEGSAFFAGIVNDAAEHEKTVDQRYDTTMKVANVLRQGITETRSPEDVGKVHLGHDKIREYGEKSGDPRVAEFFAAEDTKSGLVNSLRIAIAMTKAARMDSKDHFDQNEGLIHEAALEEDAKRTNATPAAPNRNRRKGPMRVVDPSSGRIVQYGRMSPGNHPHGGRIVNR